MNAIEQVQQQTQAFLDGVHAQPGRLIRERVEQNQNALIRARIEKHALDERIACLESSVALLQSEEPLKKPTPKWPIWAAFGLGIGGVAATAPAMLWLGVILYFAAATCFGAIAMPMFIARGGKL